MIVHALIQYIFAFTGDLASSFSPMLQFVLITLFLTFSLLCEENLEISKTQAHQVL